MGEREADRGRERVEHTAEVIWREHQRQPLWRPITRDQALEQARRIRIRREQQGD